jgi:hypothetical protein
MRELWDSGSKYQGFGSNLMAEHPPQDKKPLISSCPELAVLANPDPAFENAIFKCRSFQRLTPSN